MQIQLLNGLGSVFLLVLLMRVAPSWAAPASEGLATAFTSEAAVAASLTTHTRALSSAAALEQARGQRAAVSTFLYNPMLKGSYSIPNGQRSSVALFQPISVAGAGIYARRSADAWVDSAQADTRRARLEVAAATRLAYIDAVVAAGRVQIAKDGVALIQRLKEGVRQQNEEGEASTLDLRLARIAHIQVTSQLLSARQTESSALRVLASFTGVSVSADQLVSGPLSAVPASSNPNNGERLDVLAARERVQAATLNLRRQKALSLPVIWFGVSASVEDGQRFVGPAMKVKLPIFNRNQTARALASSSIKVADAQMVAATARVETERATAEVRAAEARESQASISDTPVADAREALASVEIGYFSGEIDLPSTVLLQQEILSGQSAAIQLLGQISAANIDLLLVTEDRALLGVSK